MEDKRIRLVFKDDDILSEAQKADGLNRSWVLLKPRQHDTVSDVANHLLHAFRLHQSCPNGLLLSISGFVLPPFEPTLILKDNEIIRVRKRRVVLTIAGNNAANDIKKLKAVEKQPESSGVLLLANEEFEKEKGGYESDDLEEEYEEGLLKDVENIDTKSRKRKAPEKLRGSKKKKQRAGASENVDIDVHKDNSEDSLFNEGLTRKKSLSSKDKNDVSNAEDNVEKNEEAAKLSGETGNDEIQESEKEIEDGEIVPKEKEKHRSRSARRKSVKRRWLKEMAKIQKQNATCESEGLRNWKEDQAKVKRKTVAVQFKGQQKWKKHQADAERNEVDDQPKGLLHWKQSPQENWGVRSKKRHQRNQNGDFFKRSNQNGDVHEKPTLNGDGPEQPNRKVCDVHEQPGQNSGDVREKPTLNCDGPEQPNRKVCDLHEQPGQNSGGVQEKSKQNCNASERLNQDSDEECEVVPIEIRPGHIRFEPLGKGQAIQQNHTPSETFQWNGITSKKKGQQWGKENRSFTPRNDYKNSNKEYSEILGKEKEKQPEQGVDFDKLPPLTSMPKEGELIAYRILELSSTWTPELSCFRVGKVSWYNAECNQIMLVPVPEYPIVSKKADEDEAVQLDTSLYKEDGSLEVDFSSLIDGRIVNNGSPGPVNEALSQLSEGSLGNENTAKTVLLSSNDKQTVVPSPETGGVDIWDQLGEALSAKKEQLSQENSWGKTPKKVQPPPEKVQPSPQSGWGKPSPQSGWGKNAKKVQPSPQSGWGKNAQKVQPSQDNSSGKQSSGGKSWSYKGLRGGGLGSTMAILRSNKDT